MFISKITKTGCVLALLCLNVTNVHAKSCYFNKLSRQYSFQLITDESKQIPNHPITTVDVVISRKSNNHIVQTLSFIQENTHLPKYDCSSRSYLTHYQTSKRVVAGNYGNFVIGDFNFSGKEGIAIASEVTKGQAQLYKFYFQNNKGRWVEKTNFVTPNRDAFAYVFPAKINAKHKTLVFNGQSGKKHPTFLTYHLNEKSGKWQQIKPRIHSV